MIGAVSHAGEVLGRRGTKVLPSGSRPLLVPAVKRIVGSDSLLEYVGAGPVESYEGRSPEANEWLEAQADRSDRFRLALSYTYRYRESGG